MIDAEGVVHHIVTGRAPVVEMKKELVRVVLAQALETQSVGFVVIDSRSGHGQWEVRVAGKDFHREAKLVIRGLCDISDE